MKGHLGINVNANATITMTAREYLETMETHYQNGLKWGSKLEQERIIKLLESPEVRAEWIEATSNTLPTYQGVIDFLTALIKGEQK